MQIKKDKKGKLKRQIKKDFCNQKEANRKGKEIKTKQHKGNQCLRCIEKQNGKITQRSIKRKFPKNKKNEFVNRKKYIVVIGLFNTVIITWKYILLNILALKEKNKSQGTQVEK